ncbi:MAG TPA: hypothetical protein VJ963_13060 [Bacteroidales bacterium]|nr:hypothetical protein [Bacteroidales bacterium]
MKNKNAKNSWFFKALSLTVILAFSVPSMTNAQSAKTNFSGKWAMNSDKSKLPEGQGGGMRMGGGDMVVTQAGNMLTVERTRTGRNGQEMTTTTKYTLDGKETVNTTQRGERKSVAKWSADGKSLTITTDMSFNMNGQTREMKSTEVWTLENPSTLSVKSTRNGRNGDINMTIVYDKK